jgi:hypothetical protein
VDNYDCQQQNNQLDLEGLATAPQMSMSALVEAYYSPRTNPPIAAGIALQQTGIAATLAAEHDAWRERAIELLGLYAKGKQGAFSTDEFHAAWTDLGYSEPHSQAVWGAVTQVARKRGLIKATGQWVLSKRPAAHARPCQLWIAA